MFPFISVSSKGIVPNECPSSLMANRKAMLVEFEAWEEEAKRLVSTANDENAKTFLTPGNFDVIGAYIEKWEPYPLFVFFNDDQTITGIALFDENIVRDVSGNFFAIRAFAVNPKFYGKGVGRKFCQKLLEEHQRISQMSRRRIFHGIVLLSELSAVPFWIKLGFEKFESKTMRTECKGVEKMKYTFKCMILQFIS